MATYVLVHGMWHGGWCWQRVAPLLRAHGHRVWAPTLLGLGERAALATPAVRLSDHAAEVVALLREQDLREVVLVGHSYGTMVGEAVAEAEPQRLRHFVYLDGPVPRDGEAVCALFPGFFASMAERIRDEGEGWRIPPPGHAFGVVAPQDVAWLRAHLVPHPLGCCQEPIRLTGRGDQVLRTYARCAGKSAEASLAGEARAVGPAWIGRHDFPVGHDAMVIAPDRVAALLLALA